MDSRRFLFPVPLAGFLIVAAAGGYYLAADRDPSFIPSTVIDKPVPKINLPPLTNEGKIIAPGFDSAWLRGRITVLNFFASWCAPCLIEHPQITALSKVRGVAVVGVNYKNKPSQAAAWLERHDNPYTRIGIDPVGDIAPEFGVRAVPETFLIDQKGRIRLKHVGAITPDNLKNKFLPAIEALKK